MVNQMLSLLRQHLLESEARYSHWVVFGGVNDLYSDLTAHRTVNKIERDLETIYGLGRQRGSVIIGITVAPWADFHRFYSEERGQNTVKLNEWITREQRTGLVDFVINSGSVLACGTSLHLCPEVMAPYRDGLHFGPEGHRRLGQLLVSTLGSAACGSAAQRQPSATR
jgi:lysophospholipase L1-like esterase